MNTMKDLRTILSSADPVAKTPELPTDTAARMRHVVVTAADTSERGREPWPSALRVAVLVVVMIAAGVAVDRRLPPAADVPDAVHLAPATDDERRQLQFTTPGGTRIIWTLDPQFELQGSTP
jgi:hypothetical protein